jgi:hypothetical protein
MAKDKAATLASNMINFLSRQHFAVLSMISSGDCLARLDLPENGIIGELTEHWTNTFLYI